MKKIIVGIVSLFSFVSLGFSHPVLENANNLTRGTVNNQRLDIDSVTIRGQLSDGSQALYISSLNVATTITSTNTIAVGTTSSNYGSFYHAIISTITEVAFIRFTDGTSIYSSVFSQANLTAGNTNYLGVEFGTQTKNSGIDLNGRITASSGSVGGVQIYGSTVLATTIHTSTIIASSIQPDLGSLIVGGLREIRWENGNLTKSTDVLDLGDVRGDIVVLQDKVNSGTLIVRDEGGTPLGDVDVMDFVGGGVVVTQSGTTATVTVNPSPNNYPYDLILDTWPSPGSNGTFNNVAGWDLNLSSFGMRGLSFSATAQASIYIKNGVYTMSKATIPAGAYVVFEDTAVWAFNGTVNEEVVRHYGKVKGYNQDASGIAFKTSLFKPCSNSITIDPTFYNNLGQAGGIYGSFVFSVGDIIRGLNAVPQTYYVENAIMTGITIRDVTPQSGVARYGDSGTWGVFNTSNCVVNFKSFTNKTAANTEKASSMVTGSTNIVVSGNFYQMENHAFNFSGGNVNATFRDFFVHFGGALDTNGAIMVGSGTGFTNGTGTSTFILDGKILCTGLATANYIINTQGDGSPIKSDNLVISNVDFFSNIAGNTLTAINLTAGSKQTMILNTRTTNIATALAAGASVNTIKDGFYKDGVLQ